MIDHLEVRRGVYHDSVRLMQASRALVQADEVAEALVAMATDLNLRLLGRMGFAVGRLEEAGPNDLVVAIRAADQRSVDAALAALDSALLTRGPAGGGILEAQVPRTIAPVASGASLALISVPGEHAFVEAMDALRHGLDVMIFSDNVPLEEEVILKREAARRGLLVMGPDCGTAIVNGVGLGFANVCAPGPVGIVGAAGTGIQQLCCLLDDAGVGVRSALGTGSRDLSEAVGGSSTLRALEALDADPAAAVLVVVSKPPFPAVGAVVRAAAGACSKPTILAYLGEREVTLEDAAAQALEILARPVPAYASWPAASEDHRPGVLRGLFSGGSLGREAETITSAFLGTVASVEGTDGHAVIDLGEDAFTRGRAHPMIDQRLRLERILSAADDRRVGVILLDVVLGHGAHPDPASELAPAVTEAVRRGAAVVVSLCGTRGDPQGRNRQAELLHEAGASVWVSNAAAARHAARLTRGTT